MPERKAKEAAAKVIDYAGAALIGDTLATLGTPNPGALNALYDARSGQRSFAKARAAPRDGEERDERGADQDARRRGFESPA